MAKHKKTREETLKDFLKIKKALKHFPKVQELISFPGGNTLYQRIVNFWGRYSVFREAMSSDDQTQKRSENTKIIVISPDKGVREYIVWFLGKRSHSALEVATVKEALQKLSAYSHILAVIDKSIEKEATGFIKKLHDCNGQAVIFETPFHSELLEAQVIRAIQIIGLS